MARRKYKSQSSSLCSTTEIIGSEAGRLHKPVQILVEPEENSQLKTALVQNLHSAVHAALLLLPEQFTEIDFYKTVANLSYNGDFRMIFGEDKDKVSNIVNPQLSVFREIYAPILKHFDNYVEIPQTEEAAIMCRQDTRPIARVHHLNHLPRTPQVKLVRMWSQGPRTKDTEDCLRAIAHDPECSEILEKILREIVWKSSVSQSLKGILTAGVVKSIKYSALKIMKMISSNNEQKSLPVSNKEPNKVETMIKSVTEKQEEPKEMQKRVEP
ncbi:phosphatidate cytidylyltransferase, mitochondrial [Cephus cinctus]|uniref:Phosphatidate cytidylyltransferase, mitochondrial n=1 Tax=Cephus cinctus TaxID=211228 RepID=A0AAJ7FEH4_CEPCN|nr:phosphatidate cytidylyltransferase, mitochondrial [Cephus cinctus]